MEAVGPVALCVTLLQLRRAGLGRKDDTMILPEWGGGDVGLGKFLLRFVSAHFSFFKWRSLELLWVFEEIVNHKNLAKVLAHSKEAINISRYS